MLLLVAGATMATVILRWTRARMIGLVGGWPASAQVALSVAAGLLIGVAPQIVPRPIASWILFLGASNHQPRLAQ